MTLAINPGSGHCANATFDHARANMRQWIEDCNLPGLNFRHEPEHNQFGNDRGGRFYFTAFREGSDVEVLVTMPGLPLEQVRFMASDTVQATDYPRIFTGEHQNTWWWPWSLLKESDFEEQAKAA